MSRVNDPLISPSPRRRARRSHRGQTLVEFALVIPIFITLVVAIAEFAFMFSAYLSISFVSRDGAQIAAELGDTPGADIVILSRIEGDITAPVDKTKIDTIDIFWANTDGSPHGGAINTWKRGGSTSYTFPSGTVMTVPYSKIASGYPETARCNVISAVGCASGHTTIDTIGITIKYKYAWITPFPGLVTNGGSPGAGFTLVQTNMMRLEPVK
jgi:Flp pilus assembly protein TadG